MNVAQAVMKAEKEKKDYLWLIRTRTYNIFLS